MKTIKVKEYSDIPNNFTGIVEIPDGTKFWYKKGKLHREDDPAVEWIDETKEWWIEDKRHREDGPAVEWANGSKYWWIEGEPYNPINLKKLIETSIFFGKEKGKYNLEWFLFLTDQGIKEFPIIPGMEENKEFTLLFNQVFEATSK